MKLLLVDGHNLLFRAFGVPFKFESKKGTPLHVTSTFISILRRASGIAKDDALGVVFDPEGATTNHLLTTEYKANRDHDYSLDDDSPFRHLPIIKEVLDYLGIPWIEQPGFEADDVIASLTYKYCAKSNEGDINILSTDTDFYQLLNNRVNILKLLPKGRHEFVDSEAVMAKYGITPEQYVELKSWVGDKADNIKGIDGIGWRRGMEIILGKRLRDLTEEELQRLELNRKLITLNHELPVDLDYQPVDVLYERSNNDIFDGAGL